MTLDAETKLANIWHLLADGFLCYLLLLGYPRVGHWRLLVSVSILSSDDGADLWILRGKTK